MANLWNQNFQPVQQYGGQQANGNSMISFINDDSIVANYPVAPGYTVALINVNDPNNSKMYIKSIEPNGMPNQTRVFSMKEITPRAQDGDVVSRQEFDALNEKLQQLLSAINKPANPAGGAAK